jgi:hypothetical protein
MAEELDEQIAALSELGRTHSLFRQGREIVKGALPDVLERECMRLVLLKLATALEKGFCHALA